MAGYSNGKLNSVRIHNYNSMLNDCIYISEVNNYMFRPIATIFRLLQFLLKECHIYDTFLSKL